MKKNFLGRASRIIFLISACLALMLSSACFASDDTTELEQYCIENNIVNVTNVPEGKNPIEIKSLSELKMFVDSIKGQGFASKKFITETDEIYKYGLLAGTTKTAKTGITWLFGGGVWLHAEATINNSKFTICREWTTVEGWSLGADWVERSIWHQFSNNNKRVDIYTKGQIDSYLLIEGTVKLLSEPVSLHCYMTVD